MHVHALRWLYYGDCYFEVFQSVYDNELRLALHFNPSFVTITLWVNWGDDIDDLS